MSVVHQQLLVGIISVTLIAISIKKPFIIMFIVNMFTTLIAIILGSLLAIFLVAKLMNYLESNNFVILKKPARNGSNRQVEGKHCFSIRQWLDQVNAGLFNLAANAILKVEHLVIILFHKNPVYSSNGTLRPSPSVYEAIQDGQALSNWLTAHQTLPASSTCVSQSIDEIMHRIFEYTYRDFIEMWYGKVSSDRGNFHKMLRAEYWEIVMAFSERLSKLDVVNLMMNRCVKCTLNHFEELRQTSKKGQNDDKPAFKLHPSLRDKNTELTYLRLIAEYFINVTLSPDCASISSLRYIVREILAGLVLSPMVDGMCDPDYINQLILDYLQNREQLHEEQSRAYAYAATYEDFIKIINDCNNIEVLGGIRYRIITEIIHATTISSIKKDQSKAGKARSMDKGELLINRDLKRYLNQCQVAKQQCEKKIRLLGGGDYKISSNSDSNLASTNTDYQPLSFNTIMESSIAKSYFLKYLKKIGKGSLLKFWNEVEMIKSIHPSSKDMAKVVTHTYQAYILPSSGDLISIDIDKSVLIGMQECMLGNKLPTDFYQVQKQVSEFLEKDHYPSFMVSDIYTFQLIPEIIDQNIEQNHIPGSDTFSTAAFGSEELGDMSLQRLKLIEEKLEYKAEVLENLRQASKIDPKVIDQLSSEISVLQQAKWKHQLHMERTNMWWDNMGKWTATVVEVGEFDENGPATLIYTIFVKCSDVPFYECNDDVGGWVVHKTLNEFHTLHQSLKECSPWLKKVKLPKLPMFRLRGLTDRFIQDSKVVLNGYLQDILQDEILRCSQTIYSFISPGPGALDFSTSENQQTNSFHNFHSKLGVLFKRIPKDLLDRAERQQINEDEGIVSEDDDSSYEKDSVANPLYLLISEIFELQGLFRFLRQSLIAFVRVAFGRSIDRQIRETCTWLVCEPMMVFYLQTFLSSMWPNGKLADPYPKRTEDEKLQTKLELQVKLLRNIPEALTSLVGHENGRRGVLKVFHAIQDKKLNKHLFYTLLTQVMEELFPEILVDS